MQVNGHGLQIASIRAVELQHRPRSAKGGPFLDPVTYFQTFCVTVIDARKLQNLIPDSRSLG